jgi:membrane-associated phospholipid phosphatase
MATRLRRPLAAVLALGLVTAACAEASDRTDRTAGPGGRPPVGAEPTAGTWRTWIIRSPADFPVPPPPAAGSPAGEAELAEVRGLVPRRTPEVVELVNRWDPTPLSTPWIERGLEFVSARAKDPPLSSRAYALLSAAVYDAMVATWHWKYVYGRRAPEGVSRISEPGPDPTYPSEHAAIAGAASRVLAYLFPERPALRLDEAAEEAADSRVFGGANLRSDVEAGLDLGRRIGEAAVAHGRGDGADTPCEHTRPGPPPRYWAPVPGSTANPVQPCAGRWRTWVMASGDQFRPGPPAVFGTPEFAAQLREMVEAKAALTEDQKRLATFWAGGEGTPLPAGIWNQVTMAYLRDRRPNAPRAERTMALVNTAMADAGVAAWDTKYAYWDPRPENGVRDSVDPEWRPFVATPFFPSYVSGHATYSGAAARVLSFLFPDDAARFGATAREAAMSRLWGGIHWRADSETGLEMGRRIGDLFVARAGADGA